MREKKVERARGYRYAIIVVQLLQFTGVREFQSDYRHYIGYPRASQYTQTIDSIVHLIRNKAGEDRGDQSPTMRTTGNNMSNCSIHKTYINTCSKPLFYFMVGQSDIILLRRITWKLNSHLLIFQSVITVSFRSFIYYFEICLIKLSLFGLPITEI